MTQGWGRVQILQQVRIKVMATQKFLWPYKSDASLYMDLTTSAFVQGSEQWQTKIPE